MREGVKVFRGGSNKGTKPNMGVFKSLGLSPAKAAGAKAFRRLFGRVLPGETDSASDTDQTGRGNSSNDSNIQREKSNKAIPDSSSTKYHNRHQQDALTDTETFATASDMASPQKHVPQGIVDKENQPPGTAQLSDSFSLKIGEEKAIATSPKPVVSTAPAVAADHATPAAETVPAVPIYTDPAVIAERAIHMKFTEEALDMVSQSTHLEMANRLPPSTETDCVSPATLNLWLTLNSGATCSQNKRNTRGMCSCPRWKGHCSRHECNQRHPKWYSPC